MKTLLVASIKDEGPWLVEWIAYHRAIGFTDILICQNDSTDGTDALLSRLSDIGEITYIDNSGCNGRPQLSAYRKAYESDLYRSADWCLCIDSDEYFVPHDREGVEDFLQTYSEMDAIAVNWLNFGSSGNDVWQPGLLMDRFTRCAAPDCRTNFHFKSFHRIGAGFSGFGPHRPWGYPRDRYVYADGTIVPYHVQEAGLPDYINHSRAQINHYSVRSREEFDRKQARGDGFVETRVYNPKKFQILNKNDSRNLSIKRFHKRTLDQLFRLMSDRDLPWLHYKSCMHHFKSYAASLLILMTNVFVEFPVYDFV